MRARDARRVGFLGFDAGDGAWAWVLGIGAPGVAIAVWGTFVAPKARWPLPIPVRLMVELVLFGAAAVGLAVAGRPVLAVLLGNPDGPDLEPYLSRSFGGMV